MIPVVGSIDLSKLSILCNADKSVCSQKFAVINKRTKKIYN